MQRHSMNGSTAVLLMTGASARASGNSSSVYTPQKKTYLAVASYSMQHSRLSPSWTKSFAMSELRLDSERSQRFVLTHFLAQHSPKQICYKRQRIRNWFIRLIEAQTT